ncbi:MAG: response regulator [Spirochaetales bacterium]|nr:response regulator [Spirochaetales bacterium]
MAVGNKTVADISLLIVDDLSFMRSAIREIAEEAGFQVVGEAENGWDGYKSYTEKLPDVVLMDITMPVMDGLKSLRRIRREYPQACVVMCSALGQQKYIIKAIQSGAKDFIVKPFRPERIVSAVKKAAGVDENGYASN